MSAPALTDWLTPEWPAPEGVRALCTTRQGGVSMAPYDSLNLGDHVGDALAHVQTNRARLAQVAGAHPVFLKQVHGTHVVTLGRDSRDGQVADGCVSQAAGVACTVMVADCLPVLLCDVQGRQVGAAHCGWRSLAGGVLGRVLAQFVRTGGDGRVPAGSVMAWLGPCIGPTAFEVGDEVRAAFLAKAAHVAEAGAVAAAFVPTGTPGKWWADLPALARQQLHALGLTQVYGNDGSRTWCTVSDPSRFFSYRRDGGASGRFAALIWRD